MDRFVALRVFCKVVEEKSFAGAARRMGLSRSAVSKNVNELEAYLGATLVRRTTRSVSVTGAGDRYYSQVQRLLGELQAADDLVGEEKGDPAGLLRISVPMSFGLLKLSNLVPKFLATYPGINVDMSFSDTKVDLLRGHFDLAIRGSRDLEDSSIIARNIGYNDHVICGAPGYLERKSAPVHPSDLADHDCLIFTGTERGDKWIFQDGDNSLVVPVNGRFECNNSLALREAALAGYGLVRIPELYVTSDLAQRKLVGVLEDWPTRKLGFWIMYPEAPFLPARLRVFIDFIVSELSLSNTALHPARSPSASTDTNSETKPN